MPQRLQRTKWIGWKCPENAVYVGRPTVFGNPYKVERWGLNLCLELFAETVTGGWNPAIVKALSDEEVHEIYELHCAWLKRIGPHPEYVIRRELRGKDLVCWCKLSQECHADLLLEIANEEGW